MIVTTPSERVSIDDDALKYGLKTSQSIHTGRSGTIEPHLIVRDEEGSCTAGDNQS